MSDMNSPNNVLPYEKVSSTGGNTAAYESMGLLRGGRRRTGRRRTGKKSIFASIKNMFKMPKFSRRTAKRTRK